MEYRYCGYCRRDTLQSETVPMLVHHKGTGWVMTGYEYECTEH